MAKRDVNAIPEQQPDAVKASDSGKAADGGFYCYIGPNIAGLIQSGTIYVGTKENALAAVDNAVKKHPLVKTLLVSGAALPEARLKVKKPGNALYANYQKLAAEREAQ